ncbi:uncharacterized protein LOC131643230 [Vicia villosa]|uniref:uncharacterized protein LOC131643230 n=1 Tax=Vicia villosa TaxID=3911 RepID=UPI00273B3A44|nr:uncharacterized protein LOC131643230 [Vicia villosa]
MYFILANRLLKRFEYVDIKHVPRLRNQEAYDLAQITSRYKVSKEKLEGLIEVKGKALDTRLSPSNLEITRLGYANEKEFEVLAIDTAVDTDWRSPIINYLRDPTINTERNIKYRVISYILMGNELFKKTPDGILLKCLGESETYLALSSVHIGACGAHQAGHKMKWLLFLLWDMLAHYAQVLHRLRQRMPRVSSPCRYPTCSCKRTPFDYQAMAI